MFTLGSAPSETGSAQKGEEAALNIAFAGLSVSGMNKHYERFLLFLSLNY